jgi:hypothetical protein
MDLEVQQMTAEEIGYWGAMERAKSTRLWLKRLGPAKISFLFDPKIRLVKTALTHSHAESILLETCPVIAAATRIQFARIAAGCRASLA